MDCQTETHKKTHPSRSMGADARRHGLVSAKGMPPEQFERPPRKSTLKAQYCALQYRGPHAGRSLAQDPS